MGFVLNLLQRGLVIVLAIGAMFGASRLLMSEARHATLETIAKGVDGGLVLERSFWDRFNLAADDQVGEFFPCGGPAMQARFIVSLARLDSLANLEDERIRSRSLDDAVQHGENLLRCAPMDGKSWLRFARLSALRNGNTPHTIALFDMADRLAPSEGWLIDVRLPIYAELAKQGRPGFSARAARDIDIYTAYGHNPPKAIQWLETWPDLMRAGFLVGLAKTTIREHRWYDALAKADGIDIGQGVSSTIILDPFTRKPFNAGVDE